MQIILCLARTARDAVARFFHMVEISRELAQISERGGDFDAARRRLGLNP